jgi:hypothetical protein
VKVHVKENPRDDFANKKANKCKQHGINTINHESRLCKTIECRHDHSARGRYKDCPGRENHMYKELLEHFRDEIWEEDCRGDAAVECKCCQLLRLINCSLVKIECVDFRYAVRPFHVRQ